MCVLCWQTGVKVQSIQLYVTSSDDDDDGRGGGDGGCGPQTIPTSNNAPKLLAWTVSRWLLPF